MESSFDSQDVCPLAAVSAARDATVRTVSTSAVTRDSPGSVTEFRIGADDPIDDDRFSRVISYGETDVYRFEHGREAGCPCVTLGRLGYPVARYVADCGRLTDRQFEVLYTAYEMGYFERPKRANAGEVAATLDINPSTFAEHLTAAQHKLLRDILA